MREPPEGLNDAPILTGPQLTLKNAHLRSLPEHSGSTDNSYACTKEHDFKRLWPNCLLQAESLHAKVGLNEVC
uniref:Acid fibroblast growth factor-like protein n=1 Tax=Homo sapiens TaxID=9606 RepID=Q9UH63_HUMAN|nr:acid fibroblast growth factor-like protein [Homo sapiens]